ncbi:MAG: hypothetical protein AAGF90_15200, partial [Pseudomonadota bacterium]
MRSILKTAAAAAAIAAPAEALIVGGAVTGGSSPGGFVKLEPSSALRVGEDTFEDENLYGFDESQNILTDRPIRVEVGPANGVIPEGLVVASHYVFFDPRFGSIQRG